MIPQSFNDVECNVVRMYSEHPSPSRTDKLAFASQRMNLRLRCCGIKEQHYLGEDVLDAGCGTGEYAFWFASNGAHVTGIDMSDGSLQEARSYAEQEGLDNVCFEKRSVLATDFPDESFDFIYCTGVLHHTPDPYGGLVELSRILRPGGRILVSLYNSFGFFPREIRRRIAKFAGGEDLDQRVEWGRRLFPRTAARLTREERNHPETPLYDYFAIPHESLHSLGEILRWFDRIGLRYTGSFAPARLRDYLPMIADKAYKDVEAGFQTRLAPALERLAAGKEMQNARPGPLSRLSVQLLWLTQGIGLVSVGGEKPGRRRVPTFDAAVGAE